ncbi:hypothetical protein RB653_009645 [Dictyostelium firmibasis]|uniref:N-acetyltransferase domain-containing protein n=1 Tax=Dictyostelium firmibasis TaxID=79012 RepID=A0AAN7U2G0_9MYCE
MDCEILSNKKDELYLIKREDMERVSKIAGDSFVMDPYFKYMFYELETEDRHKFMFDMERAFVDQIVDFNECYALDPSFNTIAFILPPSIGWPEDKWDEFTDSQRDLLLKKGLSVTHERLLKLEEVISIRFEEFDALNCYYLVTLATNIQFRKQGLASKLLNKLFEKFDHEQKRCYIECTNDVNLQFYLKHGFTILGQEKLPHVGNLTNDNVPQITFMHREPKKIE